MTSTPRKNSMPLLLVIYRMMRAYYYEISAIQRRRNLRSSKIQKQATFADLVIFTTQPKRKGRQLRIGWLD